MRKINYTCLLNMRTSALWALEFWLIQAQYYNAVGAMAEYVRYCKILKRIEQSMWNYSSENTLMGDIIELKMEWL